ncbi:MAG: PP2C family protein-serine/threonine phosphatase [Acidobacteriaceae bacterium]|nr:PP2C family protein-serine/threonine phosphatase [Acidobacteriaceae bacterium]MBV8570289.1 PP2C family protein-serine/threonine phosphatase [Acidobacteriaceae bacterium]
MQADLLPPAESLHEKLRRVAIEDPREARKLFLRVLDSGGPILDEFLAQISSPADGRLRHVVASALRNSRDKERLAPHLIVWHEIETDEFARRAISAALDGVETESAAETALAQEVARLTAAIGRETAQRERLNRELEIAREVQEHLFPQRLPSVAGIDYCGLCRPAREVGGDYYDFLELPDGRLGFAIGDVSGKGVGAALMMASLEASLRALASVIDHPAELMDRVNRQVLQASAANRYATLFYAQYDPVSRRLSYVNAGHNPPVVLRNSGGSYQVLRLEAGGPVIGLWPHRYEQGLFSHELGDLVVLFTDGVSESMNARLEEWGEDRLIEFAKASHGLPALDSVRQILAGAEAFAAGAPQHDDMTLVVLRVTG